MIYRSTTPTGEEIRFTAEQITQRSPFVWHLQDGTAVFPPRSYFVEQVSKEMFAQMDAWGTYPSENAMTALREVVAHIWDTTQGEVADKAYICPLDCGVGKTTAMKFSLRHLIDWGYGGGALLLFYKLDEAEAAYADFSLMFGGNKVGLLTSERATDDYKDKEILIITQQRFCSKLMSEKNTGTPHYDNIELFQLRGQPRELRFWDERLNPAVSYALSTKDLVGLAYDIRDDFKQDCVLAFAESVKNRLRTAEGKIALRFKDFGFTGEDFYHDAAQNHKEAFLALQGQTITAYSARTSGGKEGNLSPTREVMMTYKVEVPADAGVFPLLVLDASYRVNQIAYQKMAQQLPVELDNIIGAGYRKTYRNLNIRWWDISTGKDSWDSRRGSSKRDKLVDGIAEAVRSTDKRTLIICGKEQLNLIRNNLILDAATPPPSYLTWGRHTATNEYKNYDNIIISHLFNKPDYHYYAELRAYLGLNPEEDFAEGSLRDFWRGDVWDSLYQASLRGSARQLDGDACKPMTLWVFASSKTPNVSLKDAWAAIYPDAPVRKVSFDFDEQRFRGVALRCVAMVEGFLATGQQEQQIDADYLEGAGLTKQKLRDLRQKNHELLAHLGELGAAFETRGKARGQRVFLVRHQNVFSDENTE